MERQLSPPHDVFIDRAEECGLTVEMGDTYVTVYHDGAELWRGPVTHFPDWLLGYARCFERFGIRNNSG